MEGTENEKTARYTRRKAAQDVLANILDFGTPDAPGLERRILLRTELGNFRLSGANLMRACSYTRSYPIADGRFVPAGEMARLGLAPVAGTAPLLIEELLEKDGKTESRMHSLYPASAVPGIPPEKESESHGKMAGVLHGFLSAHGAVPDGEQDATEAMFRALKEYGVSNLSVPSDASGLFAWLAMRECGVAYDALLCPALTKENAAAYCDKDGKPVEDLLARAFLEVSVAAGKFHRKILLFQREQEQGKDIVQKESDQDPFAGLSILYHWSEGRPIQIPGNEEPVKGEDILFSGKDAYHFLVGLAARDRDIHGDRIQSPGYDKCKISVYIGSPDGTAKHSYEAQRIDLGDLELWRGNSPLDSLARTLGGDMYLRYRERPEDYEGSVWYRFIKEDAVSDGKEPPSVDEAREQAMRDGKEVLDAFHPLMEKEAVYIESHPSIKDALAQKPEPFYFICEKDDEMLPRISPLEIRNADGLDGIAFHGKHLIACMRTYFENGDKKLGMPGRYDGSFCEEFGGDTGNAVAKGSLLVASPFPLGHENRFEGSSFAPYIPRDVSEAMQDFSRFELSVTKERLPGTSDYDFFLNRERSACVQEGKEWEPPKEVSSRNKYCGMNAMRELCKMGHEHRRMLSEARDRGFPFPEGKERISLSYDGKEYLSICTTPGKDDVFLETFCKADDCDPCMGFPMPKDGKEQQRLWKSMRESMRHLTGGESVYMPSEVCYRQKNPVPSGKEAERNLIDFLRKAGTKESRRRYGRLEIAVSIETMARNLMEKAERSLEGTPPAVPAEMSSAAISVADAMKHGVKENELLGMSFTMVAANFGFQRNDIKRLIADSRLAADGKKKAIAAMQIRNVKALLDGKDAPAR